MLNGNLANLRHNFPDPNGVMDEPLVRDPNHPDVARPSGFNIAAIKQDSFSEVDGGSLFIGIQLPVFPTAADPDHPTERKPFDVDDDDDAFQVSTTFPAGISDRCPELYVIEITLNRLGGPNVFTAPGTGQSRFLFAVGDRRGRPPQSPAPAVLIQDPVVLRGLNRLVNVGGPFEASDPLPRDSDVFFGLGPPLRNGTPSGQVEFEITELGELYDIYGPITFRAAAVSACQMSAVNQIFGIIPADTPFIGLVVDKKVACARDNDGNGVVDASEALATPFNDFSRSAVAIPGASVFYRVIVQGAGLTPVTDISVNDPFLNPSGGDITGQFDAARLQSLGYSEQVAAGFLKSIDSDFVNTVTATGLVRPSPLDPPQALTASSQATVDVRNPGVRSSVLIDDDSTFDDPSDSTPPTRGFDLFGRTFPVSLTVFLVVTNSGQVDLADLSVRSPALESRGFVPPPPFPLAAGTERQIPFTLTIANATDCTSLDGADGARDGVVEVTATTAGHVRNDGTICVVGDGDGDGVVHANEHPASFNVASASRATILCATTRIPVLTATGSLLFALVLAIALVRRNRIA
ncbi:MAG: hypothetical protein HYR85_07790 [Planctomycetes bacterium]|nr:hypothetical protein [Planctomycetota bacterium]MBI3846340.1 hypothetical protein [Planctomycetota bacterium]